MANKINIEQLEEYLKQAGLENGKLEEVLSPIKELNNQRRYGLVWEEPDNSTYNTDSAEQELLKNFPFLKEVNEHRIFNGEQYPDHLLIEGDNLHALKTMQYTHKNKIDVIYIDPPYNTGNTDFVYNDKYVDNEDSWRHSKWLSFMNKRLRLARELMTDEGVIFISIGDDEQAQLKLLCDQVFGDMNFVETYIWQNNFRPDNSSKIYRKNCEFVLCYAKNKQNIQEFVGLEAKTNGEASLSKASETIKTLEFPANVVETTLSDGLYKARNNKNGWDLLNDILVKDGIIVTEVVVRGRSYWSTEKKIATELNNGTKIIIKSEKFIPYYKKSSTSITRPTKLIDREHVGDVNEGNRELDMFSNKVFNYPKPISLLKHLLNMRIKYNPNALVLDFFAGSGTTAHAVMELNKEDGGNRQAIVITNNEINSSEEEDFLVEKGYVEPFTGSRRGTKKYSEWLEKVNEFKATPEYDEFIETDEYKDLGIARAVTEQRINKVINGYTTPKEKEVEGLSNNNFYHFEVVLEPDLLDMDLNTYVLVKKTKDIIRIKEGVYTTEEVISTETVPSVKLTGKDKEVIVVLSVRVTDADMEKLVNNYKYSEKEHVIYTSYTGFEYGINNIRFEELPKELLQAIKHNENN